VKNSRKKERNSLVYVNIMNFYFASALEHSTDVKNRKISLLFISLKDLLEFSIECEEDENRVNAFLNPNIANRRIFLIDFLHRI
jgi:hypothetical protein